MDLNPSHIVAVRDLSPATIQEIAAHLDVSTEFEHLVYREAELDAVWSLTGFLLEQRKEISEPIKRLHEGAHRAHDLVGEGRPQEAAALLRQLL